MLNKRVITISYAMLDECVMRVVLMHYLTSVSCTVRDNDAKIEKHVTVRYKDALYEIIARQVRDKDEKLDK